MAKERGISRSWRLLGAGVQPGDSRQLLVACAAHGGLAPSWPWNRRQCTHPGPHHLCLHWSMNQALLSLAFETRTVNHTDAYFLYFSEFI